MPSARRWASLSAVFIAAAALCLRRADCIDLLSHDFVRASRASAMPRAKLSPRHKDLFASDSLFDGFARTLCDTGVVPRKELFETWAAASLVHARGVGAGSRIADLVAGHGLLSWAMLLLDSERTAVCVDARMPESAEIIAEAMLADWPALRGRWNYVEGRLQQVEPSSETLLCGIHACGHLSDVMVQVAIAGNASLALMPCCHTGKGMSAEEREELAGSGASLEDFIDERRVALLSRSGFDVAVERIPREFTGKNRLIVARPTGAARGQRRRPASRGRRSPGLRIPLGADAASMVEVARLSGREAADERKRPAPPAFDVSVWLGEPPDLTAAALSALVGRVRQGCLVADVDSGVFRHPSGRLARTFRITYPGAASAAEEATAKREAKEAHQRVCDEIPREFPGTSVR